MKRYKMNIKVKEVSRILKDDDLITSEYLVYLLIDNKNIECHEAYGETELEEVLKTLFNKFSLGTNNVSYERIKEPIKDCPLIIVFYLDTDLMKNSDIITPFVEAVNNLLDFKKANAIALFVPTNGEERVECINPILVPEVDMIKINDMIYDIKKQFSIGTEK
jgi:hypothetical protein